MPENKSRELPHFSSIDELVDFFETHDLGEYWDQMPEVHFDVDVKKKTHILFIDEDLADRLTEIAKAKRIPARQLANIWLREKILEQVKTAP